jgi:hypothetical protein
MEHRESPDRKKAYPIYSKGDPFAGREAGEVFRSIFESRHWDLEPEAESVSGPGSSLRQTRHLIAELPAFLRRYGVRSILDIPCGDFNWMRHVDLEGIEYTGADVVEAIVVRNRREHSAPNRRFELLDLTLDQLPAADLVFCRDCLVHFSFGDIARALVNLQGSGSRYLMTTTFPEERKNEDIATGGWRPLNFELPPFSWGKPVGLIVEHCTEQEGAFADKSMALWRIPDLKCSMI